MNYFIRRIVTAVITLFLVSVLCFFIFNVIRGDIASSLGGIWVSPEQLAQMREEMGLNQNIFVRYINWLINFLSGNLGNSFYFRGEAISVLLSQRFPVTITLALISLFFILVISFSVSLLTVKKKGGIIDNIVNSFTAVSLSIPGFFLGLLLIFIFGFSLKLFIPGNYVDYRDNFIGFIGYMCFPALAIAIPNSAMLIKFLRGSLFQELKSDYVRTAKSKGGNELYILWRHVLKNACLPALTMLGMITAEVFSGSIIIEQVFSIPGIGRLLITAISSRDYPLIQTLMVYIAFLVVCANLLTDFTVMLIDPRIKLAKDSR
ncbi:MAG: ABC transporter permease [Treponema sp.]|nr:ABC transporter permease [Treponema sp.]